MPAGVLRVTSGEVTSGALTTGRSLHPFHQLSGHSVPLNTHKAIKNKNSKKLRAGNQGNEACVVRRHQGAKWTASQDPGTRSASPWLGHTSHTPHLPTPVPCSVSS